MSAWLFWDGETPDIKNVPKIIQIHFTLLKIIKKGYSKYMIYTVFTQRTNRSDKFYTKYIISRYLHASPEQATPYFQHLMHLILTEEASY